jgi:predicted dehydrogenase
MKFKWGILATGNISSSMAHALQSVEEAALVAVASRTLEKADAFGETWSIPSRYGSYQALVKDPEVEIVYIGTPHSHHYDNMLLCLENGKHVLCEKAFTINASQARECIQIAQEKQLFLMEAMWMRTFPAILAVRQLIQAGAIGEVRLIQADFFYQFPFDPQHRLYKVDLGGGALLDLGIYPLSLTHFLLGKPELVSGEALIGKTGVDVMDSIILQYEQGAMAQLACGMLVQKPAEAMIVGSEGWIRIPDRFISPDQFTIYRQGGKAEVKHFPYQGNGYVHEVEEVHRCLREGALESPLIPAQETLSMMEVMDELRASWGVYYPFAGETP